MLAVKANLRALEVKVSLRRFSLDPNRVRKGIKEKAKVHVKTRRMLRKGLEKHHQEPGINLLHELLTGKKKTRMSMKMKTRNKMQIRRRRWMVMTKMTRFGGEKLQKQNRLKMRNQ